MKLQGDSEKQRHLFYEFDRSEPIGHGGMGVVYKGRMVDEKTGAFRDVAIKEVQPEGDSQTRQLVLDRARREASIQIRSDNLVEMLGFVETEERKFGIVKARYYIVSEFLDGVTLDKVLDGVYTNYRGEEVHYAKDLAERYMANREEIAIYLIKNILSAIVALHDSGFLHRDIDPSNVMITADGKIKLIDFGIAKQQSSLTSDDGLQTDEGTFVGKVEYASPELIKGELSKQNSTTDIYAIGVLLYRLLTGLLPFDGNRFEIINGQLYKNPDLKKIKTSKYRNIVKKAMAKPQKQRYSSASMMRAALDGIGPSPSWVKNVAIGGSILLMLVIALIIYKNIHPQDQPGPNPKKKEEVEEIDKKIDEKMFLDLPMSSVWDTLKNNPFHSAALYRASLEYEKRFPDREAINFWSSDSVQGEKRKYLSISSDEASSKRLSYVFSCMAYDHSDEKNWKDDNFKSFLRDRVENLQKEYPNIYVLPEGIK